MMQKIQRFYPAALAVLAALLCVTTAVQADFNALRTLLGGHYARISQLTTPADKAAFRSFFQRISLPQYRLRTPNGQMLTRDQALGLLEKPALASYGVPENATIVEQSMTINTVTLHSQTARAVVTHITSLRFTDAEGRFGAKDAEHNVTITARLLDHWVRTPSGWRLLSTEPLTEDGMMDQKPFGPKTAPAPSNEDRPSASSR